MRTASVFVCVLGSAIVVFLFFYGRPLIALASAKWEFQNSPEMSLVPKPLPPESAKRAAGRRFEYFGYQFESPTSEVKEEKRFQSSVVLNFSECAGVVILQPTARGDIINVLRQAAGPGQQDNLEYIFGKEAVRSSYEFRSKILNLTPADLHLFSSRHEMVSNSVLLGLKGAEAQRFKNGLYKFETSTMRGFLEGNIAVDKGVVIDAFDHEDRRLTLIVGKRSAKACFGQPELNEIIFSLRPVQSSE